MPLITCVKKICDPPAGEYFHWGATTQDIMDTATVLQIRAGLALIEDFGAETIADAISGAIVYETPKLWVVSKAAKRRVNVMELLEAADTLRPALKLLQSALLADRQG